MDKEKLIKAKNLDKQLERIQKIINEIYAKEAFSIGEFVFEKDDLFNRKSLEEKEFVEAVIKLSKDFLGIQKRKLEKEFKEL